jgi:hypothetical protein
MSVVIESSREEIFRALNVACNYMAQFGVGHGPHDVVVHRKLPAGFFKDDATPSDESYGFDWMTVGSDRNDPAKNDAQLKKFFEWVHHNNMIGNPVAVTFVGAVLVGSYSVYPTYEGCFRLAADVWSFMLKHKPSFWDEFDSNFGSGEGFDQLTWFGSHCYDLFPNNDG